MMDDFWKNSYFNAMWITSLTLLKPFGITKILKFESQLKILNFQSSLSIRVKSKTHVKSCILGLNFVDDLAQV